MTVADLATTNVKRSHHNHETYRMLYDQCVNHIRHKHAMGYTEATWTVPSFVIGRGLFDVSHAMRYCIDKLRLGGFDASPVDGTTTISVSWNSGLRRAIQKQQRQDHLERKLKDERQKKKKRDEPLSVRLQRLSKSLGGS